MGLLDANWEIGGSAGFYKIMRYTGDPRRSIRNVPRCCLGNYLGAVPNCIVKRNSILLTALLLAPHAFCAAEMIHEADV